MDVQKPAFISTSQFAAPGTVRVRPLLLKPQWMNGLSERLLISHYENIYGGAVRRLHAIRSRVATFDWARAPAFEINGLKREELFAASSVILHEIYFDSLGGHGDNPPTGLTEPPDGLAQALERDFGSVIAWRSEFTSIAKALAGGSGWAILAWSEHYLVADAGGRQGAPGMVYANAGAPGGVLLRLRAHSRDIRALASTSGECPSLLNERTPQQPEMPVVGLLGSTTRQGYAAQLDAFRQGLSEAGFVEGRNVAIEYRWADDQYERLPGLAADLVRRQVAVIATLGGNTASVAAKAATATIPIVFHGSVDPIEAGLVTSLNRPGGNVTGVVTLNMDTGQKRLELIHELLPVATTIGLLLNPANVVAENQSKNLQAAAYALGLQLRIANASTDHDLDAAFAALKHDQVRGLIIGTDGFLVSQSEQLAALTLRYALPTIFQYRAFVIAGGLMSYGGSVTDSYRLSGVYTGRILKGEKPADLPVQQATKVELIVNLKTARTLGITFPITLLGRADEVIE